MKTISSHPPQETRQTPSTRNLSKTSLNYIIIKWLKTSVIKRKSAREKRHAMYRGTKPNMSRFLIRSNQTRRPRSNIFKVWRKKKSPRIPYLVRNLSQKWGWNKDLFRNTKAENIYEAHICITENVNGNARGKMVPDRNADLPKACTLSETITTSGNR